MSGDGLLTKKEAEIEESARERFDSPRLRAAYYVAQVAAYRSEWVRGATWGVLLLSWLIIGYGSAVWLRVTFPGVPWGRADDYLIYALVSVLLLLWVLEIYQKYRSLLREFSEEAEE